MLFNFEFTLPNGKGRLPSRFFFSSMNNLGIDIDKYLIPNNWILTPEDMILYCQSIEFDLLGYVKQGGEKNYDYNHVKEMVAILKSWSEKGYIIRVL